MASRIIHNKENGFYKIGKKNNDDDSSFVGVSAKNLFKLTIINWEKNRPPDMTRIPPMIKQFKKQNYVDGYIYLAKDENGVYHCYDGIHRLVALKELYDSSSDIPLYHRCMLHISDYDENYIEQKFKLLNKCVPVPELYTEASYTLDLKDRVEYVVKQTQQNYPKHFSAKKRPQKIHENRDGMIDKVTEFLQNNKELLRFSKEQLYDMCITQFNNYMKEKINFVKITKGQRDKCILNDCYLFIEKKWELSLHRCYIFNEIHITRNR